MKRAMSWWLALAVASGAAQAADRFDQAADEMKKELDSTFLVARSGVFVVAGDLPRAQFDGFRKQTVEGCAAALAKDFFSKKPDGPIRIYLFRDKASYEKWVKKLLGREPSSPYGFYMPARQAMMMNIGTGGGTLVHEMTHALTDPDFPGCPTWFFEGLGSLFEQCHVTRDGHIRGAVNWRLPILLKGGFTELEKLVTMSNAEFRGAKESLNYANARYLCLYLQERGLLTQFYKTFRDACKEGKDKTGWDSLKAVIGQPPGDFEKEWHAWVKTLKWPPN